MITLALFAIALVIIVAISINVITKVKERKSYVRLIFWTFKKKLKA